mgnify:CR=1 FL=1
MILTTKIIMESVDFISFLKKELEEFWGKWSKTTTICY